MIIHIYKVKIRVARSETPAENRIKLEWQYLFLPIYYLPFAVRTDFFQCITTNFVSSVIVLPHLHKPQLIQQHPHLGSTELYLQLQIDHAKYIGHAVHLVRLAGLGDAEMLAYLVFFQIGSFETAHVLGKAADVRHKINQPHGR